ncbi:MULTISPECIES: type IV pilus modification PilV family protein [Arcobacteraceae]|uniref:Prepilin-type N-terminal cleavage/methylation domain-containing protein n=1 Tax=Poseidonibacter parvus TaxID=1850254 RepID=A0A1P8KJ42_9BACT|nr:MULTISPECIES: hypothetical protein [Arcobacteraceae]APW64569.1 hypothetical protein LPB137_01315 [Poseidonibacter parvus]
MKKSFSLMEVIIAIIMLSVVMLTLLQVKSDNIFLVTKSKEKSVFQDYIQTAININEKDNINENRYLGKLYTFKNDDIRRELKDIKIKVKKEEVDTASFKNDVVNFSITTYETSYSIEDDIKKNMYSFKIKL